ncbi:MAG TPA: dTMP kinase [Solirubrobacterales bacterium]|nr:dTMP kinase [Solirubrobacterales bacterium]
MGDRGRRMAAIWGRHLMFISLEGVDGSGKSTQARLLVEALGGDTVAIREPGGTGAAERIRELLADPGVELEPLAELMLFLAARADLTERVIRPALEAGRYVVADRFSDSSVAYQGVARGLGVGEVIGLCETATDGLWPDLTLLLRIDPEAGLARAESDDRFEREGLALQQAVAEAYAEIAIIASDRVVVIDATGSVEEVHRRVMEAVRERSRD